MLPNVPYQQRRQEPQITALRGVNYRPEPVDGELAAATNLSSRRYPFLAPREGRSIVRAMANPHGAWAGDHLVYVDGTDLICDGVAVGTVEDGPKQFAAINSKLVIWPDKKYIDFNTNRLVDLEAEAASVEGDQDSTVTQNSIALASAISQTGYVTWVQCWPEGTQRIELKQYFKTATAASFDGTTWTLTDETEVCSSDFLDDPSGLVGKYLMLREGKGRTAVWQTVINAKTVQTPHGGTEELLENYGDNDAAGNCLYVTAASVVQTPGPNGVMKTVQMTCELINVNGAPSMDMIFTVGDAVKITGDGIDTENVIIREIEGNKLIFDDGTFDVEGTVTVSAPVSIKRIVPGMDYICASENRLWGVSNSEEGEVYDRETGENIKVYNRVIHASSLGDPCNFNVYDGLSTDSYSLAVAEAGDFTGCIGYRGDVLFFKERKIIRIAGDYPADYAMYVYDVPGISTGSWRSAQIIDDVLYYLSRDGVRVWSGNEGELISYRLGDGPYLDGVAGTDGSRYYLSARAGNTWSLHVFDALHNIWYREDDSHALDFCLWETKLHMLLGDGLWQLGTEGETVEWSAELAPADESVHLRKNYRWIRLRLVIPQGSTVKVYVAFGEETYAKRWETTPAADFAGTVNIPLPPNRCDKVRIKMTGYGDFTLKDVVRAFNAGSLSTR